MRLAIILVLALFCYAHLAESGGRKRRMKKLAKQIKNLQEDIECLKNDMKRCKSELKVLDDKFAKMLTCLYKKDPKAVCTFFPGESFPAGDGCNVCTCGRDEGFPMCSLRPVPCESNDGCPPFTPNPDVRCFAPETCDREKCEGMGHKCCNTFCGQLCKKPGCYDKKGKFFEVGKTYFDGCNTCVCTKDFKWICTKKYCPPKDKCMLKVDPGPCKGYFPSWFYHYPSGTCKEFIYGGCLGNDNRFPSKKACRKACWKKGCCYNGCFYKKGQPLFSADGCNKCWCDNNGNVPCTKKYCFKVCPPRSNVIPGLLPKCSKSNTCPKGKMCCPYGCKNYCVEPIDRGLCATGLPMTDAYGVVYCGKAQEGFNCPQGSTCNSATGVCCSNVECPKKPPAGAKKCPKKKPCPKGKMCCTYDCKNLCVDGVERKCPHGSPAVDAAGNELFCGRGPGRVDCPRGTYCNIHPTDRYAVCCKQVQPIPVPPVRAEPVPVEEPNPPEPVS